ncbi:restriction endonuclease subunit S [Enterococcus sp. DIV0179]|uniref:restriction endonuclease subunit S n=1 Tax=Enterococcus sp. DIV0179 TaxID=2774767 RepID=UPI003D2FEB4A
MGELANIVRGASPRPIQDPKWFDTESDVGWLRISDVTEQDGRIHYLKQRISKLGQEKTRVLTEPHLLLSIAATVGKPVVNYVKTGVHDGFLIFLNPIFEREFIFQWLEMFRPKWQKYGQPGSQVNLNSELVRNQEISLPSGKEQQKISNFFKQLDDTIALHQQKLDQLKRLKQSFLQILFGNKEQAPKVRFAGFDEEWEQRKLRDSIKVMDGDRGSNYPHDSDFFENGDTLFLDTGNVTKNGFKFDSVKYITKEKDEQLRSGKLEKNDFVLTSRGTLGNVGFYDELVYKLHPKLRINSAMLILRNTDKQLSYSYLHTLLKGKLISDFMRKNQVGSAQPHITKSEFLKLDLNVPCGTEEQNKVGEFFKNLDHTINLHQTKLEKLKQLKQAFLQKMFI